MSDSHTPPAPRVSVVMPTFNRVDLLPGAMEQCLGQTYPHIELIVVNDGSTDGTRELLCASTDARIRVCHHDTNRGLPEALNTGFRHATGEYLTWSADDDRFAPRTLETMVAYLETHRDVGLVYAGFWEIDADGAVRREVHVEPPEVLPIRNCVLNCRLYRRAVAEAVGEYDPAARLSEDYDYWLRVAQLFPLAALPEPLYYVRRHNRSLTSRYGGTHVARIAQGVRLRRGITDAAGYRKSLAAVELHAAFVHIDNDRRLDALRSVRRAITTDPARVFDRVALSALIQSLIGKRAWANIRARVKTDRRGHN